MFLKYVVKKTFNRMYSSIWLTSNANNVSFSSESVLLSRREPFRTYEPFQMCHLFVVQCSMSVWLPNVIKHLF